MDDVVATDSPVKFRSTKQTGNFTTSILTPKRNIQSDMQISGIKRTSKFAI